MGFVILIFLILVPLLLWAIFDPKGAWRASEAWKYKNPEANEPIDAAYALSRLGGVLTLVRLILGGIMLYTASRHSGEPERSRSGTSVTLTSADPSPRQEDLGPGTIVGYRYPSELTLQFVVLEGDAPYLASCTTGVGVYEHTNAIVVQVTRSVIDFSVHWSDDPAEPRALRPMCDDEKPSAVTRELQRPLGGRPFLTAAPMVDPATVGLAYARRPAQPLEEVAKPGVKQPLRPVRIDPSWTTVPLLAPAPAA
ncbi:hypothetical protein MYK68_05545 [Gordonia sp. PP30]|uniref:DUF6199 family natural product biosynthesis protein n=1 Tax=Gordonia sp. PP30 TaxID=2935861 RepID=UPI001FFFFE74|nr:DUF6199 family natural product biosynthesis protein [Gordonia sp. PP30]UQE76057.1 hypothetical protein MYK68_05545 [Gordonia sp. PP30]